MRPNNLLVRLFPLILLACQQSPTLSQEPEPVQTGAQVLIADHFAPLKGLRVGLITNHTAMVGDKHLIDFMAESDLVNLVALFGPEHGLRGEADAGARVSDGRDARTGLPVYSLYGQNRAPTTRMLGGVEVLVFDIQDVGARFYTYISTMGLSMQAAARQGIPFVVLDRPNPIDGNLVSGFVLENGFTSFVGQYPIPVVHGLTVGELAQMIKGEGWLPGLENLDLHVVSMSGWKRWTQWGETGLPWIAPSPNIPDLETALVYPGMCFFEGTSVSEGRGTMDPFKQVGAPWGNPDALAAELNSRNIEGVTFEPVRFTPRSIPGMSDSPKLKGTAVGGVRLRVTDSVAFEPVAAGIHVLHAFYSQASNAQKRTFFNRDWLGKLAGTDKVYTMIVAGKAPSEIQTAWEEEVAEFNRQRLPYLLY